MERINNRKYGITATDCTGLGFEVERALESIKNHEYGIYKAADLELKKQLALRIVEGMSDWQWQHNKGVRLKGDTHIQVEVYELHELQKRIDETMESFDPFAMD